jgi:hypothetical protein
LVSKVFDEPIAAISFVDKERQWFKAEVGFHCRVAAGVLDLRACGAVGKGISSL